MGEDPHIFGNGCIEDLSNYIAETSSRSFARKSCNFAVKVNVEDGYQLEISNFAYNLISNVPLGSSTAFSAEYFFVIGSSSVTINKSYAEDSTDAIMEEKAVLSGCGESDIFRINTSLTAKRGNAGNDGVAKVELANEEFTYDIKVKSCNLDE